MPDAGHKICFLAYCCEPNRGSEWGVGWSFVQELSRTQPVWVVTHEDCRAGLDAYLRHAHTGHAVYPVYVALPRWLAWTRSPAAARSGLHYYLWQFAAARALRQLHARVHLDLVQHVSLSRWWMPSAGATLASRGVAFVFGPVGGGDELPAGFRANLSRAGRWLDGLRRFGRSLCRRDPLLTRTIRRADVLIAATPAARSCFERYGTDRIELDSPATCSTPDILSGARFARDTRPTDGPFTFAGSGGLDALCGVDLILRALARANLPDTRYVHAYDGPMRAQFEALARELGVGGRVIFLGHVSHAECVKALASADAVVHVPLRDSAGVLPDLLHAGVPVVTLDRSTSAMLVNPACGQLIALDESTSPEAVIDEMARTMRAWHGDRDLLAAKARAALENGQRFLPEQRGQRMRQVHERAIGRAGERGVSGVIALQS